MLDMILLGASVGSSLFQARESNKVAKANARAAGVAAGVAAGQAVFSGEMERFQIRNQARYEESLRRRGFAQSIGSQRAASAAAGIIGGRTQQLIEARSQSAFTREQTQARFQESTAISSSIHRQASGVAAARQAGANAVTQGRQQQRQATLDLADNLISAGTQGYQLWQQDQALQAGR